MRGAPLARLPCQPLAVRRGGIWYLQVRIACVRAVHALHACHSCYSCTWCMLCVLPVMLVELVKLGELVELWPAVGCALLIALRRPSKRCAER